MRGHAIIEILSPQGVLSYAELTVRRAWCGGNRTANDCFGSGIPNVCRPEFRDMGFRKLLSTQWAYARLAHGNASMGLGESA